MRRNLKFKATDDLNIMSRNKKIISPFILAASPMSVDRAKDVWGSLAQSISKIFDFQASTLSFEDLYRKGYDLIIQKHGELLYKGLSSQFRSECELIFESLEASPDSVLKLESAWQNFKLGLNIIKDILMYMDRNYVKAQNLDLTYDLGVKTFREVILSDSKIKQKTTEFLLKNIQNERNGALIDKSSMKRVTKLLIELGLGHKNTYKDVFEGPFLEASQDFYVKEAQTLITSSSCPDFLQRTEERLKEEQNRIYEYMDECTARPLQTLLEDIFISQYASTLIQMENSGCLKLLQNNAIFDLNRMYRLFSTVPACLKQLADFVADYVEQIGMKIVNQPNFAKDEQGLINALLKLRNKFYDIVQRAFERNVRIETMVILSIEKVINSTLAVTQTLNSYLDHFFKKDIKGVPDHVIIEKLDQAILLFRFIRDKDIFENHYRNSLAKRLLQGISLSDDAEALMITKLKTECGSHYTSKLEGMLKDMKVSEAFLRELPRFEDIEIKLRVLTAAYWPSDQVQVCNLPDDIRCIAQEYSEIYLNLHNGRRVHWRYNMGSAELRALFGGSRHEILGSTYQMMILMLFNEQDSFTYQEILEILNVNDTEFIGHLKGILRSGVLLKNGKDLNLATQISFNPSFKSKLFRVKLPVNKPKEYYERIAEELPPTVEEDRKHLVDACVVRVMKARRNIFHNSLVQEVIRMVNDWFVPDIKMIKLRIEGLIEKEYIERDLENPILYKYIA